MTDATPPASGADHDREPGQDPDERQISAWDIFWALPKATRAALYGLLALTVLSVLAVGTGAGLVRRAAPDLNEELRVAGLKGSVEVVRDDRGIPQLYGDNVPDLMLAQGYVHAQERFYEMDVRRHVTSGRLSELFGEATLETDRTVRTLGWRRVAEEEVALLRPATREALEAYADGVNAYLKDRDLGDVSVEYTLLRASGLRYTPEPWTSADSLAWLKAMAWDLRSNTDDEIGRALTGVNHTAREVEEIYPTPDTTRFPPILDSGAVVDGAFDPQARPGAPDQGQQRTSGESPRPAPRWARDPHRTPGGQPGRGALAAVDRALDAVPPLVGDGEGVGSNSWVVSGERTASREPMLANDPHLGVSVPGVWMPMGLHCRTVSSSCPLDVSGFTFSGLPGVVIGHNRDIAWGFTNLTADVADLYVERVRGDEWQHDGTWRPLTTRTERIEVRDGKDVTLTVRESKHGPLLSDVSPELSSVGANAAQADRTAGGGVEGPYAVSLAWTALQPRPTADAILGMNLARDFGEFREAARQFAVPAQNLVYADREGHIGYQTPGWIPVRGPGHDGRTPVPGWLPRYDWADEPVPFAELPWALDPPGGVIVTANQPVLAGAAGRRLQGVDVDQGYRARRIHELLEESGDDITPDDMTRIQLDDQNPLAPTLVPYLLRIDTLNTRYYRAGQRMLGEWDYGQPVESAPAAYFNAVWRHLLRLTFHDEMRPELLPDGSSRWIAAMEQLLANPGSTWWDDRGTKDVIETRDDILAEAMRAARDELTKVAGLHSDDWSWGKLHRLALRNSSLGESGNPVAELVLNRDDWGVPGGGSAVNATSWNPSVGYEVESAPSMRMVATPGDWDDSRWINLTGVSGHPMTGRYVDQTWLWAEGETLPWLFSSEAVDGLAEDRQVLRPAPADGVPTG